MNNMENIPYYSVFVPMDVRFLYTNILGKEEIEAVEITWKETMLERELFRQFSTWF